MIEAKIVAHSVAPNGKEIVTFELIYPRFIHAEMMTHRLFSRNAASSRAIPVEKMIEMVRQTPAMPVHWGKNEPGMQANEELDHIGIRLAYGAWLDAADAAANTARKMARSGAHKQIVNRILEPFQLMKTIVTATEYDNFFWLRKHSDAQPEIRVLAEKMWEALQESTAVYLQPGEWHVPYFSDGSWRRSNKDTVGWYDQGLSLEQALAISSSCCAQVSYRKLDDSLDKAQAIYKRLVESTPVHASPFEHAATPMISNIEPYNPTTWQEGTTHVDREGNLWSGNFMGFVQYRQLIPNNVCKEYHEITN